VSPAVAVSAGDTAWVLISAALVLLMVPGLAFFYGGLVRGKSSLNTMMMSAVALGVVGVQWVLFGYSFAFEPGGALFGGLGWLGLAGVGADPEPTYSALIPHLVFAIFQAMFAVITAALISGALVERMRFTAYLAFILLWTTLVYDPLAHWVWGDGGWLRSLGALDFAGGTVVHVSAGVSALVAALLLGPRRDFKRVPLTPHNVPFTLLGAGLLWFGWFGFNAGSALAADGLAATAFVTTFTAAAAALCCWVLLEVTRSGRPTAVGAATGVVAGLVGITPAAGFVTPRAALAIGALAAGAAYGAMQWRARTHVDDSLDVFACHGVAGFVGAVLTGVFATTAVNPAGADGLLAGNPGQVWTQLIAVAAAAALAAGGSAVILLALKAVTAVRVAVSDEIAGVDLSEHGEAAYHGGEVGTLGGWRPALGDSVLIPAEEVIPAPATIAPASSG
jgi:Amt family ammonium transporter